MAATCVGFLTCTQIQTYKKDSKERLIIMTDSMIQIFREIPFFRPQNNT